MTGTSSLLFCMYIASIASLDTAQCYQDPCSFSLHTQLTETRFQQKKNINSMTFFTVIHEVLWERKRCDYIPQ